MKKGYFSQKVVDWYGEHHRNLPWRDSHDPYKIWLSEIILQQTRVAQGLPYYERIVKCYPDVKRMARARPQEVLRQWQGLGYYSRARNMHACAQKVVTEFNGVFPRSSNSLKKLPGIGDYTAAAIASIAFDEAVAVVDGNVYRVLARVFGIDQDITSPGGRKVFRELANALLPARAPGIYNQAVMEFGALQCVPQPRCQACILRKGCKAFAEGNQHLLPVKSRKPVTTKRYFNYFVVRKGERILMNERRANDIWKGLYDFPLSEQMGRLSAATLLKPFQSVNKKGKSKRLRVSAVYKQVLTHQTIFARFIEMPWQPKGLPFLHTGSWYTMEEVAALPKPRLIVRFFHDRGIG